MTEHQKDVCAGVVLMLSLPQPCSVAGWYYGSWCIRGPEKALEPSQRGETRMDTLLTTHNFSDR